jgi:hypothetical protein
MTQQAQPQTLDEALALGRIAYAEQEALANEADPTRAERVATEEGRAVETQRRFDAGETFFTEDGVRHLGVTAHACVVFAGGVAFPVDPRPNAGAYVARNHPDMVRAFSVFYSPEARVPMETLVAQAEQIRGCAITLRACLSASTREGVCDDNEAAARFMVAVLQAAKLIESAKG